MAVLIDKLGHRTSQKSFIEANNRSLPTLVQVNSEIKSGSVENRANTELYDELGIIVEETPLMRAICLRRALSNPNPIFVTERIVGEQLKAERIITWPCMRKVGSSSHQNRQISHDHTTKTTSALPSNMEENAFKSYFEKGPGHMLLKSHTPYKVRSHGLHTLLLTCTISSS